jgi:1,4-alpha-glucan branching enzyme
MTPAGVRFELLRPGARSVALAGSFNRWSTASHPLTRVGSRGLWSVVVALPPGEHLFMYVVDEAEWVSPPLAEDYSDDGFGARNGIVLVQGVQEVR